MHLKSDFDGRPIAFHLTGGEVGDSPLFKLLLDLGPYVTPRAALADKGYDAKANRAIARARGIAPAIPFKSTAKDRSPSSRRRSTGATPGSSSASESSSDSSASPCAARRPNAASPPSSPSP
ncbi:transposase [Xanthobacter autotrophicus]|uniref:transposase n=1 Tax=Xanthobacter TaxID=279 RepID=UPI0024AB3CF5|nr:transposase [Xanthobacter autotrophicus]